MPVSRFGDPRQAPQASKDPDKAMGFRQSPGKPTSLPTNRLLSWQWSSDSEVAFCATFHPTPSPFTKGVLAAQIVSPFMRGKGGHGEWRVSNEGTVVFEFDNSQALYKGRSVSYSIASHDFL